MFLPESVFLVHVSHSPLLSRSVVSLVLYSVFRSLDRPILLPCSQIICASLRSWIRNRAIGQKLQVSAAMVFALWSCWNRLLATQRVYVYLFYGRTNERGCFPFPGKISTTDCRSGGEVESKVSLIRECLPIGLKEQASVGWSSRPEPSKPALVSQVSTRRFKRRPNYGDVRAWPIWTHRCN